jgi:Icc protein
VLKLAVIADVHCGPDTSILLGSQAPVLLEAFAGAMRRFRPDLIIELGDRINDVAAGQDRQRSVWVRRRLLEVGVPVLHALGNHDVANLSKVELTEALGKQAPYEYTDLDGVRLVVLDSQDPTFEGTGGGVGPDQQAWLARVLADTRLPALVFCHHPLDEQALTDHWYFASRPAHAFVRERDAVRGILERSGRVRAVFAGHLHWTRLTALAGIPYVTIASLVDTALSDGKPPGSFAMVTVEAEGITVEVAGLLPARFHLPAMRG